MVDGRRHERLPFFFVKTLCIIGINRPCIIAGIAENLLYRESNLLFMNFITHNRFNGQKVT